MTFHKIIFFQGLTSETQGLPHVDLLSSRLLTKDKMSIVSGRNPFPKCWIFEKVRCAVGFVVIVKVDMDVWQSLFPENIK